MRCNAYARSSGQICKAKAQANGKCKNHGGLSTGPRTLAGKAKVAEATKQRMDRGQKEIAKAGFQRWLNNGGRKHLAECSRRRQLAKQMKAAFDVWLMRKRTID